MDSIDGRRLQNEVFKKGSRTYFTSSLFFPPEMRRDVQILYAFVRVADNFVDAIPQDAAGFTDFRDRYRRSVEGIQSGDPIIDDFVDLAHRKRFDPGWTEAFLGAMNADLSRNVYDSLDEVLAYIYGSAEVIGLFMARIMGLPDAALPYAQLLGRAMQYINFIRDIDEDLRLGRRYLPLGPAGVNVLDPEQAAAHPEEFRSFIDYHLSLYKGWQEQAEKGMAMIPRRYRIPIRTASDMYRWTARRIEYDPWIVFRRKVKPAKSRIVLTALGNAVAG
jgi:phytoene synthase